MMLIVEDHAVMRRLLREFVQTAYPQADIREAADGASAMEACAAHRPELVLMDIGLPDANGIDLTARILEILPGCAVIIVSQHESPVYAERAQAAGACGYVAKPEIRRELLPAIARALGRELGANHDY